jgi:hypothetical protein
MPCAPASMQMLAQRVTLGIPSGRALRRRATLFRLTLSRVMPIHAIPRSIFRTLHGTPDID